MHTDGESEAPAARAARVIDDYTKLLITLATGVTALSATFLSNLYRGHALNDFAWAWILLGVSVLAGIFARGTYIAQLADNELKPRRSLLEVLSVVQWTTLVAGVVVLTIGVLTNLRAAPRVISLRSHALIEAHDRAMLAVACRTGDSSPCELRVRTLSADNSREPSSPLTIVETPSNTTAHVTITLLPKLVKVARAQGVVRRTVEIVASGSTETSSTMTFRVAFVTHRAKHKPSRSIIGQRVGPTAPSARVGEGSVADAQCRLCDARRALGLCTTVDIL